MKDLCRQLPDLGRLAYPMRGEATNRVLLGCKRHGRPDLRKEGSGGNDLGGKQTRRPEDYRMTAAALRGPALKSLSGVSWFSRPTGLLGKADVTGEETGKRTLSATAVGVQSSEERSAEITLGSA